MPDEPGTATDNAEQQQTRSLAITRASDVRPRAYRGGWGPWRLDTSDPYPSLHHTRNGYWISLDRCLTPADVLARAAHLITKRWADHDTISGFIRAVHDIVGIDSYAAHQPDRGEVADRAHRIAPWADEHDLTWRPDEAPADTTSPTGEDR